jgi:hypothetical protein
MTVARYQLRDALYAVELDGELFVWGREREELHRLNASAARMWLGLTTWTTAETLFATLEHDGDAECDRATVVRWLEQLVALGLVDRTAGPAA